MHSYLKGRRAQITLVISSLSLGGAEKVLSMLAKHWTESGYIVTVITLSASESDWYALHPSITRVALDLLSPSRHVAHAILCNVIRVLRLRAAMRRSQPDVIISFMDRTNVLTLIAAWGGRVPVIVCERTDPRHHTIGRGWNVLRTRMYRHAAGIVLQSNSVLDWVRQLSLTHISHVIPNPIDPQIVAVHGVEKKRGSKYVLVGMGRLTPSKRFDILLEAFAQCIGDNPDWSLLLIGDGTERQRLEALSYELGVAKNTTFAGKARDPSVLLRSADLFVMTSEYEGFPNALIEAMACGLPVIACDCPSGPREIIRDGVDGILVPPNDRGALVAALEFLMKSATDRQRMGEKAVEVVERFGSDRVMRLWDNLIDIFV
ncbi:Glycosyl transferase, group 1 [Nitrospira defluvii]|jgi:GalNAc-alpha-(1->4)-GalNAc-alpha-(1->3)-diNAcBac-PP-undecaprenol alpha-1,4-N-acetyl-D-galactosaminyltransferase|uniref:Glycosyl transferase, group 1 n=1 Tax=Nitrospira defluvii TaxID=330214 RepID=D8PGM3_9BACT|nr:Glycosyl transferase, group 1 [Nitrospira defluvii]